MFEAKCPSCSATYQVDERRVPPTGLKMRCPKCGESFQVAAPVHSEPPVLGAALGMSKQPAPPRRATMLGVAQPGKGTDPSPPRPGAPARGNKQTMLGLAPTKSEGLELASLDDDQIEEVDADELDLDGAGSGLRGDEADLPMPSSRAKGAREISLSSTPPPPGDDFDLEGDELDLTGSSDDLPDLPGGRGSSEDEEWDLPTVGGSAGLPERLDSIGLPSPVSAGLPDLGAGLPDLGADLPDLGAGLPDLEASLPLVGGNLPQRSGGNLPQNAGALPQRSGGNLPQNAANLPQNAGALPGIGGQLPIAAGAADPFGEMDPFASEDEDEDEFELGSQAGGGLALSARPAPPRPSGSDADDIFGQGPTTSPQSVRPGAGGGSAFGEVNLGGDADEEEFDAFPTEEAKPKTTGSADYGDVALDGGAGSLDLGEELDRGEVPRGGPSGNAAATAQVELPKKQSKEAQKAEKKERRKTSGLSRGTRVVMAAVLVLAVAGGALSLVPSVGPYGAYFFIDLIKADTYQADLDADIKRASERLALDTASEVELAFATLDGGIAHAPRYAPRKAYAAYIGFLYQLRFGAGASSTAGAAVLMQSLAEAEPDTLYLDLAKLAKTAANREGGISSAGSRQLSRGTEYAVVVGEAALSERNADVALKAWSVVVKAGSNTRSHYGMARALFLSGKRDEARKQAETALEKNPKHAGSRLLLAEIGLAEREGDLDLVDSLTPLSEGKGVSRGEQVDALILLGDLHLSRSRIKRAEKSFIDALKLDSGNAAAQRGLAQTLFESGRYSEALARFEASLQKDAEDLTANLGLVQCKIQLEQLEDAVKHLEKLVKKHPKSTAVAYWIGRGKERIGEKKEAEKSYEEAIKRGEDVRELVQAYIALTRLLSQKGNLEEAKTVISKAEARFPEDPAVYEALGELSSSRGSFEEAVRDYDRALALDKTNIGLRFARGIALRQARRLEEAGKDFDVVEKESPDYPGLALERGNLFQAAGKGDEALKMYEAALAEAPDDLDLKLRVACGRADAGQSKPALELLVPVIEKRPNSAEVNFCQGLALLNGQTDYNLAKLHLDRAVNQDPTRARYHLYVGWVAMELDDLATATLALDRAIELDRTLPDAYWKRGELRVRRSAVQDALDDIHRALEMAPERLEAHAAAARAYMGLGKEQDALASWAKAVQAEFVDPDWNYQYGQLLQVNGRDVDARTQLSLAISGGEKEEVPPMWLPEAHRLLAMAIGRHPDALPHWQAYVKARAGTNSPYLREAATEMDALLKMSGF